jgi:hypothetical protein
MGAARLACLPIAIVIAWGAHGVDAAPSAAPSTRVTIVPKVASLRKPARFTMVAAESLERFLGRLGAVERRRYDPRAIAILEPTRGAPISISHQKAQSPIDVATPWADRVLQGIQSRTRDGQLGSVTGWAIAPRYRAGRSAFTAATQERLPDGIRRCSCLGYKLGRAGYLYFYALATPETVGAVLRDLDTILDATSFVPGERHGDPEPAR